MRFVLLVITIFILQFSVSSKHLIINWIIKKNYTPLTYFDKLFNINYSRRIMKSFNLIDKSLLGCFVIMLIALFSFTPSEAEARTSGSCAVCLDVCYTDEPTLCQYVYCEGDIDPSWCYGKQL